MNNKPLTDEQRSRLRLRAAENANRGTGQTSAALFAALDYIEELEAVLFADVDRTLPDCAHCQRSGIGLSVSGPMLCPCPSGRRLAEYRLAVRDREYQLFCKEQERK